MNVSSCEEWWNLGPGAPWRDARPGPSPFKPEGNVFSSLPGGDDPRRIAPDVVHTFHIGIGVDLAASCIVWLCFLGLFGGHASTRQLEEKLRMAYASFRAWCHDNKQFTACGQWCVKKLGMASFLLCTIGKLFSSGAFCSFGLHGA